MSQKQLVAVTGASSGIGEATARAFSAAGHPVLMMARRIDRMEAMGLPNTICAQVDVRDRDQINEAVASAEAEYGPVDMMFANAGVARLAKIDRQPPEEWDEMIDINTKGVLNTVKSVMNGMMERRRGTLVIMSSIAGRKVYPDHTVYCGTKYFVHGIAESLREFLSDFDVRVIVLSPGVIETEVLTGVLDEQTLAEYKANKVKIGGGISADICAELILNAYNLPQKALVQEICLTPTRQRY
ncbi:MAG: SDR family oxidoreductase [Crocosphaera sp.]|nr:SDR family oxidoreductase [Crocosphaera sp.]MDJ0685790.1 SDR family oxidoreductase [Alphaproteobacteria bacterium]